MSGAMGMLRVVLPKDLGQLRQQSVQQAHLPQKEEGRKGVPALERLGELLRHAGGSGFYDLFAVSQDRLVGIRGDRESQPAREFDRPHHTDRVFAEANVRVSDRADEPGFEVVEAADVIDDGKVRDVVKEAVDRKVPAQRVLAGGPEGVVGSHENLGSVRDERLRPSPEGRDLDDFALGKQEVGEAEAPPDQAAIPEETPDLLGMSVGADVEILGRPL